MQVSSPFRHAVAICNILKQRESLPSILLRFSDRGTDQRNTLEAVKCATICIFRELNLDMCILARCAPGHSWVNPAERVMSILNLGLQNCALERSVETGGENKFKSCGSMTQIRDAIAKNPELNDTWESSIKPVQQTVAGRFQRLKLKDTPFRTHEPVHNAEIDLLKRHLEELFPDLDLTKLQKAYTKKSASFQSWMENHCRQRHYNFQIRKCEDHECCTPSKLPREFLDWLPDPVLDDDSDHYKPYCQVKGLDTTEEDRPSNHKDVMEDTRAGEPKQVRKRKAGGNLRCAKRHSMPAEDADAPEQPGTSTPAMTAQNARYLIECCECRKPRVVYSRNKLTERQIMRLTMVISETDYTCGSFISSPDGLVHVRPYLNCNNIVELSYYNSSLGRKDLCCHCGTSSGEVSHELLQKFKTVLPICADCLNAGLEAVCQRPYGKKK